MTERSEDALKAKCYTTRQVTHEEAREIAKRFIDANFNNPGERPRIGIPARPDYDDDLLLCAYIEQQAALHAEREKLLELAEAIADGEGDPQVMARQTLVELAALNASPKDSPDAA